MPNPGSLMPNPGSRQWMKHLGTGMSKDIGILSYGAYIPQRRLQRSSIYAANAWFAPELKGSAKGERAIGNWDEDAITMGVEAARDALTGWDRSSLGGLSLASTTLPFADRLNAGVIKEALNLKDSVSALDGTGSQRAGSSALIQALKGRPPVGHRSCASLPICARRPPPPRPSSRLVTRRRRCWSARVSRLPGFWARTA